MLIQCFMFPNMTTMDLIGAMQPLSMIPSAQTETVSKNAGNIPTDCGAQLFAEKGFADASKSPDVLLVPGGGMPSIDLLEDEESIGFLSQQGAEAWWIVSVCTGSLLLGMAGLLKGYRAASHWGTIDTLDAFGATPVHERVVIDRNRCTGGGVTAGVDIGLTMVGVLAGDGFGRALELGLEYNPAPPFGTGHPSIADSETLEMAKPMIQDGLPNDRIRQIAAKGGHG